jgi:2-aminoethylphosphonate-pyruvate transaminase
MINGQQWRKINNGAFTPPTHVLAALIKQSQNIKKKGGIEGSHKRYQNNCNIICEGMKEIGF